MRLPVPFAAPGERITPRRARDLVELVEAEGEVLYRLTHGWNIATTAAARANSQELFEGLGLRFITRKIDDEKQGVYAVVDEEGGR